MAVVVERIESRSRWRIDTASSQSQSQTGSQKPGARNPKPSYLRVSIK
jgi:hypothetical protein